MAAAPGPPAAAPDGPRRLRLVVAYDGAPFSGFARQRGRRTVQGDLEERLGRLTRGPVVTVAAGPTDAGGRGRARGRGGGAPPRGRGPRPGLRVPRGARAPPRGGPPPLGQAARVRL